MHKSTSSSFHTVYLNPGLTEPDVWDNVETPAHALESGNEGSPSLAEQGQDPTAAPPGSIPELFDHAELRAMKAEDKAKRIYTSRVQVLVAKAVEKVLLDAFRIGFKSANDGLRTASFLFVKQILLKMAQNGVLDRVIDRNIERWTQSSAV